MLTSPLLSLFDIIEAFTAPEHHNSQDNQGGYYQDPEAEEGFSCECSWSVQSFPGSGSPWHTYTADMSYHTASAHFVNSNILCLRLSVFQKEAPFPHRWPRLFPYVRQLIRQLRRDLHRHRACNSPSSDILINCFLWSNTSMLCCPLATDRIIGLELLKRLSGGREYCNGYSGRTVSQPLILSITGLTKTKYFLLA